MEFAEARTAYPVSALFKTATLAEWAQVGAESDPEAWEDAKGWYERYLDFRTARQFCGDGLVLIGPPGTGKTFLASAFLNEMLATGRFSGGFVTDQAMSPLIKKRDYDEDCEAVWETLTRVSCVVWDDILRFGIMESGAEGFLRARHARGVTTILTINNDLEVGSALRSFLSTYTWAEFRGKDLRR